MTRATGETAAHDRVRTQFPRFVVVGGIGFAVDAGALFVLLLMVDAPFAMRILSFLVACVVTWRLNARWTFRRHGAALPYFSVQGTGMALNYLAYSACLLIAGTSRVDVATALVIGSAIGLAWNFLLMRRIVFRNREANNSGRHGR